MKGQLIIFLLFFINNCTIIAQDSLLIEAIKKNTHVLHFDNGQLSGNGFDLLDKAAQKVPFFLIGEDHGIAEIPQFTAALFKAFKKHQYKYFATETGPMTAAFLQKTAEHKEVYSSLQSFFQAYPWSIPFYSWKEECAILEAVIGNKPTGEPLLWGLDQEFAAGYRMHFKQLVATAKTPDSRQLAETYFNQAMEAFKESDETNNPGKSFLAVIRPSDFEKLKNAFVNQTDNLALIKELEESTHIYQLWFEREGYESNRLRAELMKRHFWNYYSKAKAQGTPAKVLFKLGANHVYRGLNPLNVPDIGGFVAELASQMGQESFHLFVMGKKGTQNVFSPYSKSEADKKKKFDAVQNKKLNVSSLLKATSDNNWSLVDLKPLRKMLFNKMIKEVPAEFAKIIWSYDAVLVIPEATAATFFE